MRANNNRPERHSSKVKLELYHTQQVETGSPTGLAEGCFNHIPAAMLDSKAGATTLILQLRAPFEEVVAAVRQDEITGSWSTIETGIADRLGAAGESEIWGKIACSAAWRRGMVCLDRRITSYPNPALAYRSHVVVELQLPGVTPWTGAQPGFLTSYHHLAYQ